MSIAPNRITAASTFLYLLAPALIRVAEQAGALPAGTADGFGGDLTEAVAAAGVVVGLGRKWAAYVAALAASRSK